MAGILRGEIYWADLNSVKGSEQAGQRPILVISHDIFNAKSGTVIGLALTGRPQKAGFPLTLQIDSEDLPRQSWVKISQIRTLSVERLGNRVCTISQNELGRIIEGLNELVG